MEDEKSKNTLTTDQFENILRIIENEKQTYILSKNQKRKFYLLNICIFGSLISLILFIVSPGKIIFLSISFSIVFIVFSIFVPIVFLLNIPFIRKSIRMFKFVRQLKSSELFRTKWKDIPIKKRILNILTRIVAFFGLFIMLMSPVVFLIAPSPERAGIAIVYFFVGGGFVVIHWLRIRKYQLDILEDSMLQHKNSAKQAGAKTISVPKEELEQISIIERARILLDREERIKKFKASDFKNYQLVKNRNYLDSLNRLDIDTRLLIEEQVERLTVNPKPEEIKFNSESEIFSFITRESSIEIQYKIDESKRKIIMLLPKMSNSDVVQNSSEEE